MAKRGNSGAIAAYNAAIKAIKQRTGVSHREAQQTYRSVKARTGKAPTAAGVKTSRAVKEEAAKAGKQLAAARTRRERQIERVIERAKAPRVKRAKKGMEVSPPPRGGRLEAPEGRERAKEGQLDTRPGPIEGQKEQSPYGGKKRKR